MGYNISKLEEDHEYGVEAMDEEVFPEHKHDGFNDKDNDVFHSTKLRSEPSRRIGKVKRAGRATRLSTVDMLLGREANYSGRGRFSLADCSHVLGRYLPVKGPWHVDRMDSRAYVSQFSTDGSLFIAGYQASRILIYNVDRGWEVQKDIIARGLRWTITDTSLSPDQRYLVYASMSPIVHIVDVATSTRESYANINEIHEDLDFSTSNTGEYSFGIFSIKFSVNGREIVAGTSDECICLYDLVANKVTSRFKAHVADVNSVTFADETGNLLYSGSDDHLCKVWDRRCFLTKGRPAGVLTGHLEGITFIDSRGDGRYFISNGKDQSTKLWDVRKMTSTANGSRHRVSDWDYRWMDYPPHAEHQKHPCDLSVATYRGHSVLRTLIRCYFSPLHSTGQRYIYTGSNDCAVYIYDMMTGGQVAKLEHGHQQTVRDCSWHPYYPMIISSSWDGQITRWEFPGDDSVPTLPRRRAILRDRMYF